MDLRLDYLRALIKVAELGSFSEAGTQLNRTQGAISQQIAHLERYFGARLFNRTLKAISLTGEGMVLYKCAKAILQQLESVQQEIKRMTEGLRGKVTISASTIPGEHILPGMISRFKEKYPQIEVEIESYPSAISIQQLEQNKVQFAAVGSLSEGHGKFELIKIAEEDLVVIVAPDHPLASKSQVPPDALVLYPFITRDKSSGTRAESEKILQDAGIDLAKLKIHMELPTTEAIITAVSEGIGVTLISSIAARKAETSNRIKILPLKTSKRPHREIYLARVPENTQDPTAETFWNFMMNHTHKNRKPSS